MKIKFLFFFLIIIFGCTSKNKKETPDLKAELSQDEQKKLSDYVEEIEIGRNMAGRLLTFYGNVDDEELQQYINEVGSYVGKNSDFPDRHYMFNIINSDKANAFASPGGYILVTKGAIKLAQNEAELAAILGHEIAHVGYKHMYNTLKSMSEKDLDKAAEDLKKSKLPEAMLMRKRPDPDTTSTSMTSTMAKYLSGRTGATIGILKAATAGMSIIMEKGLDKKLEYQADEAGVKYATRAGYSPDALLKYFKRLDSQKKKYYSKILSNTHPKLSERIDKVAIQLKEMNSSQIIGATGKGRFTGKIKKL